MVFTIWNAAAAMAAPLTFTCAAPDITACNGSTYALTVTDLEETSPGLYSYELVFAVDTTGYTGASTDFLAAVAFKNVVDSWSNISLIGAPGGVDLWNVFFRELNASGCTGGNSPSTCVQAGLALNDGYGVPVAPGTQYFWTFQFDSQDGTPNTTGHIKYVYVDEDGKKDGSLGSFDTSLQRPGQDAQQPVQAPEPGTMLLLGAGAVIAARHRRRSAR